MNKTDETNYSDRIEELYKAYADDINAGKTYRAFQKLQLLVKAQIEEHENNES